MKLCRAHMCISPTGICAASSSAAPTRAKSVLAHAQCAPPLPLRQALPHARHTCFSLARALYVQPYAGWHTKLFWQALPHAYYTCFSLVRALHPQPYAGWHLRLPLSRARIQLKRCPRRHICALPRLAHPLAFSTACTQVVSQFSMSLPSASLSLMAPLFMANSAFTQSR